MTAVPSMPLGTRMAVTEFTGDDESRSRPRPPAAARVALASRSWRKKTPSSVSSFNMRSDSRRPTISDTAGVKAVSPFSCALPLARQIQIEARQVGALVGLPGLVRDRHHRQPRRQHERLLRADGHHVEPPLVHRHVVDAHGGDGVDAQDDVVVAAHHLGDGLHVVHRRGRGLAGGGVDRAHPRIPLDRLGDRLGVDALAPLDVDEDALDPVGLGRSFPSARRTCRRG